MRTARVGRDGGSSRRPAWLDQVEWLAHAKRLAPLVDGVEYFRALREALILANHHVILIGWDLHSEIDLLRGREAEEAVERDGYPVRLADLLERMVSEKPSLHVSILIWEGSPLFALERQHLPRMKRPWSSQSRIDLVWDRDSPPLASQHQKVVVVDDRLAFVGGMDLTQSRWDDHEHRPADRRRRKPGLIPSYGHPYHDIMLAVDGDAARVIGDWSRERWARAAEGELKQSNPSTKGGEDPWPPNLEPVLRDRFVALTLTQPGFGQYTEKRQVEQTYLAQIAEARHFVFIENQYFSSEKICSALCDRLREPGGPEIVLILPWGCPGTVQSMSLDTQRDMLLDRLREADAEGRLGVYWPTLAGGDETDVHQNAVYVHAKTLVVDDTLMRIGSANLANRSMGLDTELDASVWIDEDDDEARAAIAAYRRRLLAYLLGVDVERVEVTEQREASLLATIEALREGARSLHPFEHRAATFQGLALPIELADPDRPLDPEEVLRATGLAEAAIGLRQKISGWRNAAIAGVRHHRRTAIAGVVLGLLAVVWMFSPLRDRLDIELIRSTLDSIRTSPFGNLGVVAAFWLAAAVGVPVTVLIAVVAAALGGTSAVAISLIGVAGSASIGFVVGRWIPGEERERRFGGRLGRIAGRLQNQSVLSLAILRNIPIAPYALVNVACGATRIGWLGFLAGTLLGMAPGIVLVSVFGQALGEWLAEPTLMGVLRAGAALGVMVGAAVLADRLLRDRVGEMAGRSPATGSD